MATDTILTKIQSLHQVRVDLMSDRFSCPIVIYAKCVPEVNVDLPEINKGGDADKDLDHFPGRLAGWYERMRKLDIEIAANAAPCEGAVRSSVEHIMLGFSGPWGYVAGLRRSEEVEKRARLDFLTNAQETVDNLNSIMNAFAEAPAFFASLPLPKGVRMYPLMTRPLFAEGAPSCVAGNVSTTGGRADALREKAVVVDGIANAEYSFADLKYTYHELEENNRVLKCDASVLELPID